MLPFLSFHQLPTTGCWVTRGITEWGIFQHLHETHSRKQTRYLDLVPSTLCLFHILVGPIHKSYMYVIVFDFIYVFGLIHDWRKPLQKGKFTFSYFCLGSMNGKDWCVNQEGGNSWNSRLFHTYPRLQSARMYIISCMRTMPGVMGCVRERNKSIVIKTT